MDASYRVENGFVADYDANVSYGFWGEPQPVDMADDTDLRDAWHARIDEFDGATLTVTVTFADGTSDTQTLTLHTGKLGVWYPDDESGRSPPARYSPTSRPKSRAISTAYTRKWNNVAVYPPIFRIGG